MATFNHINDFVEDLAVGVHDFSANTNYQLKIALSNTAPASESSNPVSDGNGILANVTQISYTNYTDDAATDRELDSETDVLSSGTFTVDAADLVITASGGSIAAFRYIYLYNDTPTSPADPLIGYWDYGSALTLTDGDSLTITFDAAGIFSIAGA